ncbi:MAG: thiol:disulfide interchange protein DsbA/DsbL [Thiofilum sp.]|uniref:thiol:disulfide interchange protein DsbA/DsbL n=1 Tax=Thiofilum sp. TaxID=2212733 RepID=UPI0025F97B42|nr:thiol:disulfide interchange protein DsbA/DsbL [Thiofilum sp.]MBK8452530.1 thiol:disulfide interchange protein DsbA/DsbL [Thiofilum sp.]
MKRFLSRILTATAFTLVTLTGCFSESTQADNLTYLDGTHYTTLSTPLPKRTAQNKVEVAELFWYGCPHCYHLEPVITKYLAQKPANVEFVRIPATLSPRWTFHAKLYYVGQLLDPQGTKNVHARIFDALQKQNRRIDNEDALKRFFVSLGYTNEQVDGVLKSMELDNLMRFATDYSAKSGADSVPTLIVNGKYMTGPGMVGADNVIATLNHLTNKESK